MPTKVRIQRPFTPSLFLLSVLIGLYACSESPASVEGVSEVEPLSAVNVASELQHVSGDAQTGPVGSKLANDIVVRAVDKKGRPLADVTLNFAVITGDGSFTPASATTSSDGTARASWSLGSSVGLQTGEVRASRGNASLGLSATGTSDLEACIATSPSAATVTAIGSTVQLQATTTKAGTVTWTSSNTAVATVSNTGLVTAKGNGSASITASLTGCLSASSSVLVSQTIASVTVSPSSASVEVNKTTQLTATAKDANGNIVSGASFIWASSSTGIATVDANGVVTGKSAGSATVTATASGKLGSSSITVTEPTLAPPPGSYDFGAVMRGVRPRGFGATTYSLSQPTAGRIAYYVSVSGNDANPGTSSAPFRTINRAAQVALAGDVVNIGDGTYQESVTIKNSGTSSAPIVFQALNRGGVVLSGGQYRFQPADWFGGKPGTTGQFYVTIKGLIFRDYSDPNSTEYGAAAVRPFRGWRIEDCLLDRAGQTGVFIVDDNVTITRSTLQYNRIHALVAFGKGNGATGPTDSRFVGISGLQLTDVILRGNYTSPETLDGRSSSSVIKMMATRGTLVDNIESYENNGPGLWFDADNFDYVVRNSYFHDNRSNPGVSPGRGLHLELSWGPALVENNVFGNNAAEAVAVSNSWGVEVRNNLFFGNRECFRISDWVNRSGSVGQYALKDVSIHHNQFKDWTLNSCINPYGDRPGGLTSSAGIGYSNILVDYNTYEPVRNSNLSGWWNDKGFLDTIEKVRAINTEMNGKIGPVVVP